MFFGPLSGTDLFQQIFAVSPCSFGINLLHQTTKKQTEMKTIIILAAALMLQINSIFANVDGVPANKNEEMVFSAFLLSAPTTPQEATFEELVPSPEIFITAPVTPGEATFDDAADDINIVILAPVVPFEADFNDAAEVSGSVGISLTPATPAEADFTEIL
jgi:hypothetical protein